MKKLLFTRQLKTLFAFTLITLMLPITIFAQPKAALIDEMMQTYYDYKQFNGCVLVAENGRVIFKKGYGLANMEWDIPNQPDTKFRLGSITKQFTSMLIMQLVEKGEIDLQGKITDYLPDYREDTGSKITVHHLLTHTSGIPSYTSMPGFFREVSRDPYSVNAFVKEFCSGDLEFEPGSEYKYNNSGYFLLGAIIEKVTGKTYETALQENILDPAGMEDTGYDHHGQIIERRASGYQKTFNGYENAPYLDMSLPYAAGALYSTVEDLYLWDQILYTNQLLGKKYKEIMFTPFLNDYAYGWNNRKTGLPESEDSLRTISHGGGINGFNTLITRLIDDKHLIVLLNNTGGTNLYEMNANIINILYDKPYNPPKKSIASVLYKKILAEGVEPAIEEYHNLQENQPEQYVITEAEINRLGYQLLTSDKVDEAIEIFKFNIQLYPESFNVYDSLGEAYMIKGQYEPAIKNYAKSLELNPGNANAIEMLQKINESK